MILASFVVFSVVVTAKTLRVGRYREFKRMPYADTDAQLTLIESNREPKMRIDFRKNMSMLEHRMHSWQREHPFGPINQEERAYYEGIVLEYIGARMVYLNSLGANAFDVGIKVELDKIS